MARSRSIRILATAAILAGCAGYVACFACIGCASGMKGGGGGASHPLQRHPAPDVEVQTRAGGAWHPSNANGKVLVIDFWATWCGPCRDSFPRLDAVYKKHVDKGLEVMAIAEDQDPNKIPPFVRATGVTFPIALDPEGTAASTFDVATMPSEFVIDRHGVVRFVHSGYHPDDMDALEKEVSQLLDESD